MSTTTADAVPSDDHDLELDTLLSTWLHGWAAARALALPTAHDDGLRVEVGWPDQARRFVFPRMSAAFRALGESIEEPHVFLKTCATIEAMRAALPPRWTIQPQRWFMTHDASPLPPVPLPPGYTLALDVGGAATIARVLAPDGELAANGGVVLVGEAAIFDRIGTEAAHRRRGLGRAVMGALHAHAHECGATQNLLAATADGRALYATFGWQVRAPYASAVIEG
jgi:GNAT superfamily N-acetyltransferase